jgi:hypothetical protein
MFESLLPRSVIGNKAARTDLVTCTVTYREGRPDLKAVSLWKIGGRSRTRTYDPLIKSQLLYHLSYAPGRRP